MEIGRRIRELREGRGLTARDLSHRIDLTETSIYRIERGERIPSASTVEAIARGLGVPPGALFEDSVPAGKVEAPPSTYIELLELAGAADSGLERPVEHDAPGNISELFKGLSYTEAYELYQRLAADRKAVRQVMESYMGQGLDPTAEKKVRALDALTYQRMLVAFGNVYAALEKAKAAAERAEEVGEIEELHNRLVGMPG